MGRKIKNKIPTKYLFVVRTISVEKTRAPKIFFGVFCVVTKLALRCFLPHKHLQAHSIAALEVSDTRKLIVAK